MEFLSQFLPIIIYILLIIIIIVGIILGIKLIITIGKIERIVDDVNNKIERIAPVFDLFGIVSDKISGVASTVIGTIENLVMKLFLRNKEKEMESDNDE